MTPIALIEALATLLWVYTALTFAGWVAHLLRLPQGAHVAAVAELAAHLVPAMIVLVVVVLIGALVGLPSVVAFIAILFPAGLAYGAHMALCDIRDVPTTRRDLPRLAATVVIAGAVILYRQAA